MSRPQPTQPPAPPARGRSALAVVLLLALCLAASLAAAVVWLNRTPVRGNFAAPVATADALARGAYLARVGNCAGCHTARGGPPLAGGRGLPTPFGTVYAGNLTPDANTGLGRWSAEDFWQALHHGRSRDGRLLAPAFPYTSFTHVTRADSDALYLHLQSLPPVVRATPASGLRFPYNTQTALAVWRALYFRPAEPQALQQPGRSAGQSAEWQRGAYLVRGLGHCAACHAPRNALGATEHEEQLAGGQLPEQPWSAPSLAPDGSDPALQRQRLVDLLRTGQSSHGSASGPMAEVVVNSTQHWTDADLRATATYLLSLPPQPALQVSTERAAEPAITEQLARGAQLYADRCASCHGANGEGAAGAYPPLAGNPTVTLADPGNALQMLRHGGFAPATAANPRPYGMPPSSLSAQELADVLSHVRQSWGNQAPLVTVQAAMRAP